MAKTENSEHLQWIHDRIVSVYDESPNVDFLIRLREIIKEEKEHEENIEKYLELVEQHNKRKK